jgi:hypothetical protein
LLLLLLAMLLSMLLSMLAMITALLGVVVLPLATVLLVLPLGRLEGGSAGGSRTRVTSHPTPSISSTGGRLLGGGGVARVVCLVERRVGSVTSPPAAHISIIPVALKGLGKVNERAGERAVACGSGYGAGLEDEDAGQ